MRRNQEDTYLEEGTGMMLTLYIELTFNRV